MLFVCHHILQTLLLVLETQNCTILMSFGVLMLLWDVSKLVGQLFCLKVSSSYSS